MRHRICLYVPDNKYWVEKAKLFFMAQFTGYTCIIAEGGWRSEFGQTCIERIHLISAFFDGSEEKLDVIHLLARQICKELNQECVALEINGELHFIEP